MTEQVLIFGDRHEMPEPYPLEDQVARDELLLGELDELLVSVLVLRVHRARLHQLARRAEGLPATKLSWEHTMVKQYVSRLGKHGAEIARAVLALSKPTAPPLCIDPRAQDERHLP
jgi:hypothetical protein